MILLQDLTAAMFQQTFRDVDTRMLGVDLDDQLIQRAKTQFSVDDRLEFRTLDLMSESSADELRSYLRSCGDERPVFDLVTVFSVTMWIHLNHGDQGLEQFIRTLCSLSRYILVEPQPWRCYQTAARRMRKLGQEEFSQMKMIEMRGPGVDSQIVELFIKEGLDIVRDFGESTWKRKLVLFKQRDIKQ